MWHFGVVTCVTCTIWMEKWEFYNIGFRKEWKVEFLQSWYQPVQESEKNELANYPFDILIIFWIMIIRKILKYVNLCKWVKKFHFKLQIMYFMKLYTWIIPKMEQNYRKIKLQFFRKSFTFQRMALMGSDICFCKLRTMQLTTTTYGTTAL